MGLNIIAYGASKNKIESVASGFDHATKTGDNTFSIYFIDGSRIDLTIPLPDGVGNLEIDADGHLICTLTDGTVIDSGELPSASISKLTDVDLSTLNDGDTLVYNATSNKWVGQKANGNVKVSEKEGNDISLLEGQADPKDDGIYLKIIIKGVQINGNNLMPSVDGNVDIKTDGKTIGYDDTNGLEVKIDPDVNNIIKSNTNGLFVASTPVAISQKSDNEIQSLNTEMDPNDNGLYVKVPVKKILADTNELTPTTDGDVELVSTEADNTLEYKTNGLYVPKTEVPVKKVYADADNEIVPNEDGEITLISTSDDNALSFSTEEGKEGLFVAKGSIDNETANLTYGTLFDETEEDPSYHGNLSKQVNSVYLYNQMGIVIPKILAKIEGIFDLTQHIEYVTLDTDTELKALDLSVYTTGIVLFLVKQDHDHPRDDGTSEYYTTIYILIPKADPTLNGYSFVAELNMSEKLLEYAIVTAVKTAIFVEYYSIVPSGTEGAKVVVADGTLVDADTEIELSSVTPVLPKGTTISVGEYVLFVDKYNSTVTKFVKRDEIDVDVISKFTEDTDGNVNYNDNKLALDNEKLDNTTDATNKGKAVIVDDEGNLVFGDVVKIDDTTSSADSVYSSQKIDTDFPFKLGIDADGNYGYFKDGADSVTPFKSGDEFLSVAPIFSPTETYTHDSVVFKNDTDEDLYQYTGDEEEFSGAWDDSKWTKVMIPEISKSSSGGVDPSELAPVLLWENPNPSASFGAQTIALDLSEYAGIIVEGLQSTAEQKVLYRTYVKKGDYTVSNGAQGFGFASSRGQARGVSITDTTVTFTNSYIGETLVNTNQIPYKIYGVKGVLVEPVEPSVGSKILENVFITKGSVSLTVVCVKKDGSFIESINTSGSNVLPSPVTGEYLNVINNTTINVLKDCNIIIGQHGNQTQTVSKSAGDTLTYATSYYSFTVIG